MYKILVTNSNDSTPLVTEKVCDNAAALSPETDSAATEFAPVGKLSSGRPLTSHGIGVRS